MGIYNYFRTRQPDLGGALNYAFEPRYTLPLFTLPGLGTPYSGHINPTQPEKMYYMQAQRYDGKIGIVAGQLALQHLIDNRDSGING
jgi:hypothetical protein